MTDHLISGSRLFCESASYRIRVCGRLTQDWSDRLQGMRVATVEEQQGGPVTELSGVLADQSALMGVLNYLYQCHIGLISVEFDCFRPLDGRP